MSSSLASLKKDQSINSPLLYNEQGFKYDLYNCWSEFEKRQGDQSCNVGSQKLEVDRAWEIYKNAISNQANSLDLFVLGNQDLRDYGRLDEATHMTHNFGNLSSNPQVMKNGKNVKQLTEFFSAIRDEVDEKENDDAFDKKLKHHLTTGAILNEEFWWILPNDVAVLGGIHTRKQFLISYIKLKRDNNCKWIPEDDALWSKDRGRARALGREILMLKEAGYKPIVVYENGNQPGLAFVPPQINNDLLGLKHIANKVEKATFGELKQYLQNATPHSKKDEQQVSPSSSMGSINRVFSKSHVITPLSISMPTSSSSSSTQSGAQTPSTPSFASSTPSGAQTPSTPSFASSTLSGAQTPLTPSSFSYKDAKSKSNKGLGEMQNSISASVDKLPRQEMVRTNSIQGASPWKPGANTSQQNTETNQAQISRQKSAPSYAAMASSFMNQSAPSPIAQDAQKPSAVKPKPQNNSSGSNPAGKTSPQIPSMSSAFKKK